MRIRVSVRVCFFGVFTQMFAHSVYDESHNDHHDYSHRCWFVIAVALNENLSL